MAPADALKQLQDELETDAAAIATASAIRRGRRDGWRDDRRLAMAAPRNRTLAAAAFTAPFVIAYAVVFVYPTLRLMQLSFTNAPLIGAGKWVGLANYVRLGADRLFHQALEHTVYFVRADGGADDAARARHRDDGGRGSAVGCRARCWRASSCPMCCR